jgi:VanZ family protein
VTASAKGKSPLFHIAVTILIASLYGMTDEGHQHFVPGRSMSTLDWVADTIGASTITFVMYFTRLIGGR